MPSNRHWARLADWFDRSLIRKKLALWLGSSSVFGDFVNAGIDASARRLRTGQQRNFARWPILGVHLVNY
jgi:hypothetical protein